jgi:hypothetical protein
MENGEMQVQFIQEIPNYHPGENPVKIFLKKAKHTSLTTWIA